MKQMPYKRAPLIVYQEPNTRLLIQAPLPAFLDTLPILITYRGPGSALAGSAPLAPPREPAHDK